MEQGLRQGGSLLPLLYNYLLDGNGRGVGESSARKLEGCWCGALMYADVVVLVASGRMVLELLARPSMEYADEVWWTGGQSACRKLESSHIKMGRKLLGASNTVAGVAVQGELGWRKLEDRREELR